MTVRLQRAAMPQRTREPRSPIVMSVIVVHMMVSILVVWAGVSLPLDILSACSFDATRRRTATLINLGWATSRQADILDRDTVRRSLGQDRLPQAIDISTHTFP